MRIQIDIRIAQQECDRYRQERQQLQNFLNQLTQVMRTLTTVSWISPTARALFTKFQALSVVIERALRIVDQYITDLERVINDFLRAEGVVTGTVDRLRTNDVFNN